MAASTSSIKIVSFNVFGGGPEFAARLDPIADAIVAENPDIVCLQEATEAVVERVRERLVQNDINIGLAGPGSKSVWGVFTKIGEMRSIADRAKFNGDGSLNANDSDPQNNNFNLIPFPEDWLINAEDYGCLATLSRFPMTEKTLVHRGGWADDGILRADITIDVLNFNMNQPQLDPRPLSQGAGIGPNSESQSATSDPSTASGLNLNSTNAQQNHSLRLSIFNYHGSGGTFGKPLEVRQRKQRARECELRILNEQVERQLASEASVICSDFAVIAGDFNACPHDEENFPETRLLLPETSPNSDGVNHIEHQIHACDAWEQIYAESDREKSVSELQECATESHNENGFRARLKPNQNRECRFDRILVAGKRPINEQLRVTSFKRIGTKPIGTSGGADSDVLFPSDHFGVATTFSIFQAGRISGN